MTDNVNVPTPYMVEQCRKLLQPLAGNDWPQVARQAFALMTAAAPKAEPVQFTVGDVTMKEVFRRSGLTDLSNLQAVLDAVELALTSPSPKPRR